MRIKTYLLTIKKIKKMKKYLFIVFDESYGTLCTMGVCKITTDIKVVIKNLEMNLRNRRVVSVIPVSNGEGLSLKIVKVIEDYLSEIESEIYSFKLCNPRTESAEIANGEKREKLAKEYNEICEIISLKKSTSPY